MLCFAWCLLICKKLFVETAVSLYLSAPTLVSLASTSEKGVSVSEECLVSIFRVEMHLLDLVGIPGGVGDCFSETLTTC